MIKKNRYKQCEVCNDVFRCRNRREIKNRKFCSIKCRGIWIGQKLSKDRKGKGNPMYGKVSKTKGKTYEEVYGKEWANQVKRKLSISHLGQVGYWTGKKRPFLSEEAKENLRKVLKGRKITWKDKLRKPKSEEHKKRISLSKIGEKNPNWRGGIYEDLSISPAYKRWRKKNLERDSYECQKCRDKKKLVVHHKKSKQIYPELIFDINNRITLCDSHHRGFHKKFGYINFTEKQLEKFLI